MSEIQFDEQKPMLIGAMRKKKATGGLVGILLQTGIAKTAKGAERVLTGVFVVVMILIVWVNWPGDKEDDYIGYENAVEVYPELI